MGVPLATVVCTQPYLLIDVSSPFLRQDISRYTRWDERPLGPVDPCLALVSHAIMHFSVSSSLWCRGAIGCGANVRWSGEKPGRA